MSGYIYFIHSPEQGAIKIGYAANPDQRLRDLQIGNPGKLILLAAVNGTQLQEKVLHRELSVFHSRGEWFHADLLLARLLPKISESSDARSLIESAKQVALWWEQESSRLHSEYLVACWRKLAADPATPEHLVKSATESLAIVREADQIRGVA